MAVISVQEKSMNTGKKFLIRTVTQEDAQHLISIENFFIKEGEFNEWEPDEFGMSVAQRREWIRDCLNRENKLLILAQLATYVLGYAYFEPDQRRRLAHSGYVNICILKEWRGKGLGSCLLESILDWVQDVKGIEKLNLSTFSNNTKALALAKKFNFKEECRQIKAIKFNAYQYTDKIELAHFLQTDEQEMRPWLKTKL